MLDEVVAIDGLEGEQLILLQLGILNLGRSVRARGLQARKARVVMPAAVVNGRVPSSRCLPRHSTCGAKVSQLKP